MGINRGRCLWLMNHRTLRAFEVPMLIDMGFEVFCPKMFPYDEGNLSADVTYEYDNTLTISKEVLDDLNKVNMYEHIPSKEMELLNEFFDIVFIGFFPKQLKTLVEGFKGVIVMQPFGLSNGVTYTRVIEETLGLNFLKKIEDLGERFVFGQAYENIAEIECRELKNRARYLPLGLKNAYVKDEWVGGDKRILFVCPRINTSPYFKNIYTTFKKDFEGFDYLVAGAQPIEVRGDDKVAGFVPNDQYEYNMKHLYVMFYHSREKRHVHYHPFEAVKNGMPLIFMSGGILDSLGGSTLPGRCKTIKEARRKIKRIMSGDQKFISHVKKDQGVLLERFTYEYCYREWNKNLSYLQEQIERIRENKKRELPKKKIAILLTEGYLGGVLDVAYRFVKSLHRGIEENGDNVELVFGYIEHKNFDDYTFEKIQKLGIQVRKFKWRILSSKDVNSVFRMKGYESKAAHETYCVADDGVNFFEDCDHIIFIVDRVLKYYFTNKPYSVIVHDYIQRYLPQLMNAEWENIIFELQRKADAVYVMTTAAKDDCIQYAGIGIDNIKMLPLFLEKTSVPNAVHAEEQYFLWSTNIGAHKNHKMFLKALDLYYKNGGKLKCYVTGVNTDLFDLKKDGSNDDYIKSVRQIISRSERLMRGLVFKGNMDKDEYLNVLANAKFIVHPGFIDNGNMTCVDAAFLGVPCISSDYPAMRYYEENMKLHLRFANPFEVEEWVELLLKSEQDYMDWKKQLPSIDELEKFSISTSYLQTYEVVREVVGF